jgi:hypothetical protein
MPVTQNINVVSWDNQSIQLTLEAEESGKIACYRGGQPLNRPTLSWRPTVISGPAYELWTEYLHQAKITH